MFEKGASTMTHPTLRRALRGPHLAALLLGAATLALPRAAAAEALPVRPWEVKIDGLVENELVHVFGGRFEGEPNPNPGEVEDWQWLSPDRIQADVAAEPDRYSVWFRKYLAEFGREIGAITAVEPR